MTKGETMTGTDPDSETRLATDPIETPDEAPADVPVELPGEVERSDRQWEGWALFVVALLVAASGVWAWWSAAQDSATDEARTRDAALIEVTAHMETLNTLNHADIDGGLRAWADASTGVFRDQLEAVSDEDRASLAEAGADSVGRVLEAAVFELDTDSGTATVIAAVEITVTSDDGETTTKRNRFSADAVLVDGDWLIDDLRQVAVTL